MTTLVGFVTFGGINFTKLMVRGIRETVTKPYSLCAIVGKPGDTETVDYLVKEKIPHKIHLVNMGFPASLNDIYDFAWKDNNFDNLVMLGNDVIPYKYAIDSLIEVADTTDIEWMCAREWNAKALCEVHPELRSYFEGEDYIYTKFDERPWDNFEGLTKEITFDRVGLSDVHNLALFKRAVFEKIGYIDAHFYPAYYEDNDYVRRAVLAGLKSCTVGNAFYFHFWSRTIKQGSGGSTTRYFENNRRYYHVKWGGDFGKETFTQPFNGATDFKVGGALAPSDINIQTRDYEADAIKFWRQLGNR
jgi:hypothetical protein